MMDQAAKKALLSSCKLELEETLQLIDELESGATSINVSGEDMTLIEASKLREIVKRLEEVIAELQSELI